MLAPLKNCAILEKEPADAPVADCSYRYDTERLKRTQLEAKVTSLRQPGPNSTYPHYLGGLLITKDKLNTETACGHYAQCPIMCSRYCLCALPPCGKRQACFAGST